VRFRILIQDEIIKVLFNVVLTYGSRGSDFHKCWMALSQRFRADLLF
jgi:hypothetical protein